MSDQELRFVALQGECDVAAKRLIEESALSDIDRATIMCRRMGAAVKASDGDANAILGLAALILEQVAGSQDTSVALLCSKTAQCLAEVNSRAFIAAAAGSEGELALAVRSRRSHCRCDRCREGRE